MISGIILAAGASNRMGFPKALLKFGSKIFLQHIVDVLYSARVTDIVTVLGADATEIKKHLDWFGGKIVLNHEWQKGQITSIISGLNFLDHEDIHGAMICPVDHPLISQELIVDLLQAFWKSKKKVIIPTYAEKRGHPIIIAKELFEDLRKTSIDIGTKGFIRSHSNEIYEVPTNNMGILININTPDDYKSYILEKQYEQRWLSSRV